MGPGELRRGGEAAGGGARPAGLGLLGAGEEALANEVVERCGGTLLPPTDSEGLAAVFRAAALVVTNDTGPMHLAIAVGAPTIAVSLTSDIDRWCLAGPSTAIIRAGGESVPQILGAARRLLLGQRLPGPRKRA